MNSEIPPMKKLGYLHNEVSFTSFDENRFLFFPLMYSEDQIKIVTTVLNQNNCLIQGGPGTGKTQTLVNMFINAFARNKNVLYTVKNNSALLAFEEILPEYLKKYVLILSEDSLKSDVHMRVKPYVNNLLSLLELSGGNPQFNKSEYLFFQESYNEVNKKLVEKNLQIKELLELNQQVLVLNGEPYNFQMAYDFVNSKKNLPLMNYKFEEKDYDALSIIDWKEFVNHLNVLSQNELKFYSMNEIILTHEFMSYPESLMSSYADVLSKHKKIKITLENSLRELNKKDFYPQVVAKFEDLKDLLIKYNILLDEKVKANFLKFFSRRKSLSLVEESLAFLNENMSKVIETFNWKVNFPDKNKLFEVEYFKELEYLAQGGNLDGVLYKLTKKKQKDFFDAVLFNGLPVKDTETWKKIHEKILLQGKVRLHVSKWNEHANTFGFPIIEENEPIDITFYNVKKNVDIFYMLANAYIQIEQMILPYIDLTGNIFENIAVLQTYINNLQEKDLINNRLQILKAELNIFIQSNFLIPENILIAQEMLKTDDYDNLVIFLNKEIKKEITYLPIKKSYVYIHGLVNKLSSSGNVGACDFVKLFLESGYTLKIEPSEVVFSLKKTILNQFVKKLNSSVMLDSLMESKGLYTKELKSITHKMIENRFQNVCIERLLRKENLAILDTIKSLCLKEENKIDLDVISLLKDIIKVLPGVAMTNDKVMEYFPGNSSVINLLLVDDASQEGFEYLPLLLKGENVLVAGDENMFIPKQRYESEMFEQLKFKNLSNVPNFLNKMVTPSASLFDIAMSILYQNKVVLNENFRTNSDILKFINDNYYHGEMIGLKSPSSDKETSLVDVLVNNASIENGINEKEVEFIVKEILFLVSKEKFDKTIGVISLGGKSQSKAIMSKLSEHIMPNTIAKHKILVGASEDFQGRERDILLIGMFESKPKNLSVLDLRNLLRMSFSRVKDIVYLVHSFNDESIGSTNCSSSKELKKLLDFFCPTIINQEFTNIELIEQCKTIVEKDLMAHLLGREFRIKPNVRYGKFGIDLMVFGKGANLAIEIEGDNKGIDYSWEDSIKRQIELENIGWNFYRVLYSQFCFNKPFVFESLFKKLDDLGIEGIVGEQELEKKVVSKIEY